MTHALYLYLAANPYHLDANSLGLPTRANNPLTILALVIQTMMVLVGMLAVLFLIIGGLQMVGSAGSPQRFKNGREAVIYSIVGIGIAISAYALVGFIAKSAG